MGGGRVGSRGSGWGGGGGKCERRSEVFVKIPHPQFFFFFWRGGGGRVGGGVQGGCGRRIEDFVKIKKKNWGGGGRRGSGRVWGVKVDVNGEVKFL